MSETAIEAAAIYDVLVECCGAVEDDRPAFIAYLDREPRHAEWRFGGWLGFGGKLYSNSQGVYVDCYGEDRTPLRAFAIRVANERIAALAAAGGLVDPPQDERAARIVKRLLDESEPRGHVEASPDFENGSRTGGELDCVWCAAREFLAAAAVPAVEGREDWRNVYDLSPEHAERLAQLMTDRPVPAVDEGERER